MSKSDSDIIVASTLVPEVFGEIFDRHAHSVLRFFVRRIGNDDAGALVGDVFRIAFERRESFETSRPSALPWLYGIATHQLLNHRRGQSRRLRACAELSIRAASTEGEAAFEAQAMLPKPIEALETLPEGERTPLLLSALEEVSYEDIATALAIPLGTIRSRINRARKRLRAALEGGAP